MLVLSREQTCLNIHPNSKAYSTGEKSPEGRYLHAHWDICEVPVWTMAILSKLTTSRLPWQWFAPQRIRWDSKGILLALESPCSSMEVSEVHYLQSWASHCQTPDPLPVCSFWPQKTRPEGARQHQKLLLQCRREPPLEASGRHSPAIQSHSSIS